MRHSDIVHPCLAGLLMLLVGAVSAQAQIAVVSPILVEHTAAPGDTIRNAIKLKNMSAATRRVRLYQTDYTFSADGTNAFDAPGTLPRSNAGWINVSTAEATLGPNEEGTIDYVVTVPASPVLSGTYWSMVMVEEEADEALAVAPAPPALLLTPTVRYGVQVAVLVGSGGAPRLEVTTPVVEDDRLVFDLTNPGDVAVRPAIRIELYDAGGVLTFSADARRGLLYPSTSMRQTFSLGRALPAGRYTAIVLADIGTNQLVGARHTIVH